MPPPRRVFEYVLLFLGVDTDSIESEYDEIDEETVEFFIREETEIIDSGIEDEA